MAETFQRPVARILIGNDHGRTAGAGFLAPRGVVITCAHVINTALGRNQLESARPEVADRIELVLPFAESPAQTYQAEVMDWHPPLPEDQRTGTPCNDIAVLRLTGEAAPDGIALPPQSAETVATDTPFRVMGFPRDYLVTGCEARGTVQAVDSAGWHNTLALQSYGQTIAPGFSGAPAIDNDGQLLGMVVESDTQQRQGQIIPVSALMLAWPFLVTPYRGLNAFRASDQRWYFGRRHFIDELTKAFFRQPMTLLTGPSGSGKSSLLQAGLIPVLRQRSVTEWIMVACHPGERPLETIADALNRALRPTLSGEELLDANDGTVKRLQAKDSALVDLARAYGKKLCLVIDQFEEALTLARPQDPEQFRKLLALLVAVTQQKGDPTIRVILGMRSDFLTDLQSEGDAADLIDALHGGQLLLRPLKAAELAEVITGPAKALNVDVDDRLTGDVTADIARNPDSLPLLEFMLTRIWEACPITPQRRLTLEACDAIGGVTGALAHHADEVLANPEIDRNLARLLFMQLVYVGNNEERDTRRPRSRAGLDTINPDLWPLAQKLADARLLVTTAGPTADAPVVGIVHEALFRNWDTLKQWLEEKRAVLRGCQQLEERYQLWLSKGKHDHDLLAGSLLQDAKQWLTENQTLFSEDLQNFIANSQKSVDQAQTVSSADKLWNGLELLHGHRYISEYEITILLSLQDQSVPVRLAFLTNVWEDENCARRFCRAPSIVLKAAFAGSPPLFRPLWSHLLAALTQQPAQTEQTIEAYFRIITAFTPLLDQTASRQVVTQAVTAIEETTHSGLLQVYSMTVTALGQILDAESAVPLVTQAVSAMGKTTDPNQLQAFSAIVTGLGRTLDAETAAPLVTQAVIAIGRTRDCDQLQAYSTTITALGRTLDAKTAALLVRQAVTAIGQTKYRRQLQPYITTVIALCGTLNAETKSVLVTEAVAAMGKTTDPDRLQAYNISVTELGGTLDAERKAALATQALIAIEKTANHNRLQKYSATITALSGALDAKTCSMLTKQALTAMMKTTDINQLQAYITTITALGGIPDIKTQIALTKKVVIAIREETDQEQFQAYRAILTELGRSIDAEIAARLVTQAVTAMEKTTNPYQLQVYRAILTELGRTIDTEIATRLVTQAVTAMRETTDPDLLQAYSATVTALSRSLGTETAAPLVTQAVTAMRETTDPDLLQAYSATVTALSKPLGLENAAPLVKKTVAEMGKTMNPYQLQAYSATITALGRALDSDTKMVLAKQALNAMEKTTEPYQLQAYSTILIAFDNHTPLTTPAAYSIIKEISEYLINFKSDTLFSFWYNQKFSSWAETIPDFGHRLPSADLIPLLWKLLLHPLCPEEDEEKLVALQGSLLGAPETACRSIWTLLDWHESQPETPTAGAAA